MQIIAGILKIKIKHAFLIIVCLLLLVAKNKLNSQDIFVTAKNNPSPGYIFMSPVGDYGKVICYDHYLKDVYSNYYTGDNSYLADLKMLGTEKLVGFSIPENKWYFFNLDMEKIDSLTVPGGYEGDFHDIIQLPNGNLSVFAVRNDTVDMSAKVQGGRPDAVIKNYFLFEFNSSKNIVFQWNAMEHYNITDVTSDVDLTAQSINPFNCNSIFYDNDGNYIISTRFFDELTKINRSNGDIIWRMGGSRCKNNQFTFQEDTRNQFTGFSHQHDARRLANGNLLLFDNGNLKSTQESRVVEYQLDEANRRITKVWEYRHNPAIYSRAMGNAQRLPTGNTLIGWGGNDGGEHTFLLTEVTSTGTKALEVIGAKSLYRAYKFPYKMDYVIKDISQTGNLDFNNSTFSTHVNLNVEYLRGNGKITVEKHRYEPHNIEYDDEGGCTEFQYRWVISDAGIDSIKAKISIDISLFTGITNYAKLKIYFRPEENTGTFTYLNTNYNSATQKIEANINRPGEYFVVYNDYQSPSPLLPINESKGISITPLMKWNKSVNNEKYRLQISTDSTFQSNDFDSTDIQTPSVNISNLRNIVLYYWRVKALSQQCESPWSTVSSFTTMVATPDQYEPVNGSKDLATDINFKWGRVDSATNYRLQISKSENFSNIIYDYKFDDIAEFNQANLDYYTDYYWRVSASLNEFIGNWSSVAQFRTVMQNVTLTEPNDNESGIKNSDTLRWNMVRGANLFNVQIATDIEFRDIIVDETGLIHNEYVLSELLPLTKYYWRVKAFNDESKTGWSLIRTFTTNLPPPELKLPNKGYQNQKTDGILAWNQVSIATGYEVILSTDNMFADTVLHAKTSKLSVNFSKLSYRTNYYWKVKSIDKEFVSDWSEVFTFRTVGADELTAPELIYPNDQVFGTDIQTDFRWQPNPQANSYEFQIDLDSTFKDPIQSLTELTDTTVLLNNLEYNKKYFWRVLSKSGSTKSAWSDYWEFTTKLNKTVLIIPENKTTDINIEPEFEWSAVDGAVYYEIQIAKDSLFENIIYHKENISSLNKNDIILEYGTQYYWRVRTRNFENFGDYSDIFTFQTTKILGFEEKRGSETIFVYPSPATDVINIYIPDTFADALMTIINSAGKCLYQTTISGSENNFSLDIATFPDGVYLLIVRNRYEQFIKKFVIIR